MSPYPTVVNVITLHHMAAGMLESLRLRGILREIHERRRQYNQKPLKQEHKRQLRTLGLKHDSKCPEGLGVSGKLQYPQHSDKANDPNEAEVHRNVWQVRRQDHSWIDQSIGDVAHRSRPRIGRRKGVSSTHVQILNRYSMVNAATEDVSKRSNPVQKRSFTLGMLSRIAATTFARMRQLMAMLPVFSATVFGCGVEKPVDCLPNVPVRAGLIFDSHYCLQLPGHTQRLTPPCDEQVPERSLAFAL